MNMLLRRFRCFQVFRSAGLVWILFKNTLTPIEKDKTSGDCEITITVIRAAHQPRSDKSDTAAGAWLGTVVLMRCDTSAAREPPLVAALGEAQGVRGPFSVSTGQK
jgi:hypothetical protein